MSVLNFEDVVIAASNICTDLFFLLIGGLFMDNDNDEAATDEPKEARGLGMELVANLKQRLTNIPNEYSYFDHGRLGAWAGPKHWKFKPMSKFAGNIFQCFFISLSSSTWEPGAQGGRTAQGVIPKTYFNL